MLKNIAKIFTSHIIVKAIGIINIALVLMFFSVENFGYYSFTLLALNLFAITIDPVLSSYLVDYKSLLNTFTLENPFNFKAYLDMLNSLYKLLKWLGGSFYV